jgi:hypothetical protein
VVDSTDDYTHMINYIRQSPVIAIKRFEGKRRKYVVKQYEIQHMHGA